jgi:hypothetical protein
VPAKLQGILGYVGALNRLPLVYIRYGDSLPGRDKSLEWKPEVSHGSLEEDIEAYN